MIIRTKIDWSQEKKLDPIEKEKIEAKAEVVPEYDPYDDLNEEVEKEALIDTTEDKIYVQVDDNKICMMNLLSGEYILTDTSVQRFQERIIFKGNLDEIEKKLTNI